MPQWLSDNSGFIYTGFFQDIKNMGSQSRTKTVKLYVLGTSPDNDKIIFIRKESLQITEKRNTLFKFFFTFYV